MTALAVAPRAEPSDSARHVPDSPWPARRPSPWLLVLPLGIALALLPPFTTATLTMGAAGILVLLTHPRWALYLLALTVPYQGMLDVKYNDVSISITEGIVALLLVAWITHLVAGRVKPARGSPLLGVIAALLVSFALTVLVASNLAMTAKEMVKWVELGAVFLAGTSLLETRRHRLTMAGWLLGAAASQAIFGLIQSALRIGPGHFMIGGVAMRAYGSFEQPNPFGGYLGLAVPLAVSLAVFGLPPGKWRKAVTTVACLCAGALLLTLSRGAWVAQIAALLLVMALSSARARHALLVGTLVTGVLIIAFGPLLPAEITERVTSVALSAVSFGAVTTATVTPENWAVLERLSQWYAGWEMFTSNPLLGVGIGNYNAAYEDYRLEQWPVALGHAHNHYLTIAAEAGLLGFLLYLAFWGVAFRTAAHAIRRASSQLERAMAVGILGCLTAFATHNLFDVLFVHGMGVTVGLLLTLLHGSSRHDATA